MEPHVIFINIHIAHAYVATVVLEIAAAAPSPTRSQSVYDPRRRLKSFKEYHEQRQQQPQRKRALPLDSNTEANVSGPRVKEIRKICLYTFVSDSR